MDKQVKKEVVIKFSYGTQVIKQGGLSDEVWSSTELQKYLSREVPVFGYIGERYRTTKRDKILENKLKSYQLGPDGIACWLTSTTARHLMDDVDRKTTEDEFIKRIDVYAKDAFLDVLVWNHPDHTGIRLHLF